MFRFTIRDVLWLMMVVGLGIGWWRHHRSWQRWCGGELLKNGKAINEQFGQIIELTKQNTALINENRELRMKAGSVDDDSN
jgi:hypothetical protein